jgi:hypothetical protein
MVDLATVKAAIRGDNDAHVLLDGPVCPNCFRRGSGEVVAQLRRHAENQRRFAGQYDEWADGPIDLPGMGVA